MTNGQDRDDIDYWCRRWSVKKETKIATADTYQLIHKFYNIGDIESVGMYTAAEMHYMGNKEEIIGTYKDAEACYREACYNWLLYLCDLPKKCCCPIICDDPRFDYTNMYKYMTRYMLGLFKTTMVQVDYSTFEYEDWRKINNTMRSSNQWSRCYYCNVRKFHCVLGIFVTFKYFLVKPITWKHVYDVIHSALYRSYNGESDLEHCEWYEVNSYQSDNASCKPVPDTSLIVVNDVYKSSRGSGDDK